MFKVKNGLATKTLGDINHTCNLWNNRDFVSDHVKSAYFGTESFSYLGVKLYDETSLTFCWHQHFLIGNQQISLYPEIQI